MCINLFQVTFVNTKRGRRSLLHDGYSYYFHRTYSNSSKISIWRCSQRQKCNSTIKILEDENKIKVLDRKQHKCEKNDTRIDVLQRKQECRERAKDEVTPIKKLYNQCFRRFHDRGLDILSAVPEYNNIKTSLYKTRNRHLNVQKTHFFKRADIVVPEKFTSGFLLFDDGVGSDNRMIAFATEKARNVIEKTDTFFSDGTFWTCPKLFSQLYTIHGDISSSETETNIVPLIYILMPNREQHTYHRAFQLIREHVPNFNPKTFILDYEMAPINVIKDIFSNTAIKGCNFHLKQALIRKAKELNLYSSVEGRQHVQLCSALAHLKQEDIVEGWLDINETAPNGSNFTAFNDYFVSQWLDNKTLQGIWVCNGARHRTTNGVEAWHKRWKSIVIQKGPRLLEFLQKLKDEANYFDWELERINFKPGSKLRKTRSINTDAQINAILNEYRDGKLSIHETLHRLCPFQHCTKM